MPIAIESRPPAAIAHILWDEQREISPIYSYLLKLKGLGTAEGWLEKMGWGRSPQTHGSREGWYLYATPASEKISRG